jgi:hypothetical protein
MHHHTIPSALERKARVWSPVCTGSNASASSPPRPPPSSWRWAAGRTMSRAGPAGTTRPRPAPCARGTRSTSTTPPLPVAPRSSSDSPPPAPGTAARTSCATMTASRPRNPRLTAPRPPPGRHASPGTGVMSPRADPPPSAAPRRQRSTRRPTPGGAERTKPTARARTPAATTHGGRHSRWNRPAPAPVCYVPVEGLGAAPDHPGDARGHGPPAGRSRAGEGRSRPLPDPVVAHLAPRVLEAGILRAHTPSWYRSSA